MASKQSVVITGCSNHGLGSELAKAFHARGLRVLATARSTSKMSELTKLGIETFELDIQSASSIAKCTSEVSAALGGTLDILINNAGIAYSSTILDTDLDEARKCFDTNFFSIITVTQAFFSLLHEARMQGRASLVVNHTSIAAGTSIPTQGIYAASKAAAASLTDGMRLEFAPFGVRVIELRSGAVESNVFANQAHGGLDMKLPASSLYNIARGPVEGALRGEFSSGNAQNAKLWATGVVSDLLKGDSRRQIWRGGSAYLLWLGSFLPVWAFDSMLMSMTGMDAVAKAVAEERKAGKSNAN